MAERLVAVVALFVLAACSASVAPSVTPSLTVSSPPTASATAMAAPASTAVTPTATAITTSQPTASPALTPTAPAPTATATPSQVPPAAAWPEPTLIDAQFMDAIDMALDADGHVHVAASDSHGIYYFTNASGEWVRTDLVSAPDGGAAMSPTIAVSPSGKVVVAYSRWSRYDFCVDVCEEAPPNELDGVYLAINNGEGWGTGLPVPGKGEGTGLAFNGDELHAVRYGSTVVSYATLGSDWSDPVEIEARGVAFASGRDERPGLLVETEVGLSLVQRANNGQLVEAPVPATFQGTPARLAFDRLNRPHVVFGVYDSQADAERFMHTMRDGDAWTQPEQLAVGGNNAIAVDDADRLHVAYATETSDFRWWDIRYALIAKGAIDRVRLDRSYLYDFGPNGVPTLALDSTGRPHVVFSTQGLDDGSGLFYVAGPAASTP